MKPSIYNVIFQEEDGHYLYNSFLNSFAKINPEIASFLESVAKEGKVNGDIAAKSLAPLEKGGFLIADNKDELAELKLRNRLARYSSTSFGITFAPTNWSVTRLALRGGFIAKV